MKLLKYFFYVCVLIVLLGIGVVSHAFVRFDLLFNPIVSEIRNDPDATRWGELTALTPDPFKIGEDRTLIHKKMLKAGFKRVDYDSLWRRYFSRIDNEEEVFVRDASRVPCTIKVYVFLRFDINQELDLAEGTQHEHGCM